MAVFNYFELCIVEIEVSMVDLVKRGEIGMGFSSLSGEATKGGKKFLHESRKAHYIFPKNGLAGVVKKNSTMSGEATNGGIFFYHNC